MSIGISITISDNEREVGGLDSVADVESAEDLAVGSVVGDVAGPEEGAQSHFGRVAVLLQRPAVFG